MSKPTQHHLIAAKRILRYLRGTLNLGINFQPGPLSLSAYCDVNWAGDPLDRSSITGMVVFLGVLLLLGQLRSSLLFLGLLLRLHTGPWLLQLLSFIGLGCYLRI